MSSGAKQDVIKVLIVDDIPDTRENLRKLLAFEPDIKVVGDSGAGTGHDAVEMAKEFKPDVVLMDINMPDMDGIQATKLISEAVRTTAVVMMSVQSEPGYLRQAMLAGARDFLTKPISSEELYSTIRRVYDRNAPIRQQEAQMKTMSAAAAAVEAKAVAADFGLPSVGTGRIIIVYSPQAGAGTTTIATNIASALMRQDSRILLIDCNLQFGDVDAFLNLQATSNIADLTKAVNDIDHEMLENVLVTHGSGLKVLVAPPHPEQAYDIASEDVKELVMLLANSYDYVVVDTPTQYDDMTLKLFDVADRIVLIANPTIPSVRNTRKILDIFDSLREPAGLSNKVMFVLNRVVSEKDKGRGTIPAASIENHLKRQIVCSIPLDERSVLTAVNQGVPLVAKQRSRSPGREMVELAEQLRQSLQASGDIRAQMDEAEQQSKGGRRAILG